MTARIWSKVVVGLVAVSAALAALSGTAWAAQGGYLPSSTSQQSSVPGGFSTVAATKSFTSSGGTMQASVDGLGVSVTVPAGALPQGGQVILRSGNLSAVPGSVAGIAVSIDVGGHPLTQPLSTPITVVVDNPAIKASDVVLIWNGSSFIAYSDASVTAGSATIKITSDPVFVVSSPSSVQAVPGATSVTTGEPFVGGGLLALALLVLAGGALVWRRHRHTAEIS
ncbi:MAG: hypothetical protein M1115_06910 [Actinobacteria bacterium]|nr:hypothetical protein [Actinomycetota bacterium]